MGRRDRVPGAPPLPRARHAVLPRARGRARPPVPGQRVRHARRAPGPRAPRRPPRRVQCCRPSAASRGGPRRAGRGRARTDPAPRIAPGDVHLHADRHPARGVDPAFGLGPPHGGRPRRRVARTRARRSSASPRTRSSRSRSRPDGRPTSTGSKARPRPAPARGRLAGCARCARDRRRAVRTLPSTRLPLIRGALLDRGCSSRSRTARGSPGGTVRSASSVPAASASSCCSATAGWRCRPGSNPRCAGSRRHPTFVLGDLRRRPPRPRRPGGARAPARARGTPPTSTLSAC